MEAFEHPKLIPPSSAYYIMGVDGPDPTTPIDWLNTGAGVLTRDDDLLQIAYGTCTVDGQIFIAFGFPPQHVAENPGEQNIVPNAYAVLGCGPAAPQRIVEGGPKITGRIEDWWAAMPWTNGTRLVFALPPGAPDPVSAKLSTAELLDWSHWRLCIRPRAAANDTRARVRLSPHGNLFAGPTGPADDAGSQLALGFGLVLAQTDTGGWTHLDAPLTINGRTELWHTRLVPSGGRAPTVRAIRSLRNFIDENADRKFYDGLAGMPSFDPRYPNPMPQVREDTVSEWHPQIISALTPRNPKLGTLAKDLVGVSSSSGDGAPLLEIAAEATLLSALGGSARLAVQVPQDDIFDRSIALRAWMHEQRFGRDQAAHSDAVANFVPFGHRILVTTAITRGNDRSNRAALEERVTVLFLDTTRAYPTRDMAQPFGAVTVLQTAPLNVFMSAQDGIFYDDSALTRPHMVNLLAMDAAGAPVHFAHPLMWSPTGGGQPYRGHPVALNQQRVAYAAGNNGAFVTDGIVLQGEPAGAPTPFSIQTATIHHPALDAFSGSVAAITIRPLQPGEVNPFGDDFARIVDPKRIDGHQHTNQFGGMAAPRVAPDTLSRAVGAWFGVADAKQAMQSFGQTTLLGCLPLSELTASIPLARPQITTTKTAAFTVTRMDWSCGECTLPARLGPIAITLSASAIRLTVSAERALAPELPVRSVSECVLTAPVITLGIDKVFDVEAHFASIGFSAAGGTKTSVHAAFNYITFGGLLSFVNGLLQALPSTIFSDAPQVSVDDTGARIACPVALPSLALGVFALTNVAIDTLLEMPFQVMDPASASTPPMTDQAVTDGVVSLTFDFGTAEQPFTVGVGPLAGTGYFHLAITPRDLTVDGAIGFGGNLELNLVVVSGQVMAECGIRVLKHASGDAGSPGSAFDVGGFMHSHGSISLLSIVTVSLDVMLLLDFDVTNDSFTGQATVTLRVELLFFHKSVSFTLSKTFGGSPPPASPTPVSRLASFRGPALASPLAAGARLPIAERPHSLASAMTEAQWRTYCGAFAA